jgi:hypothetical protein
MARAFFRMIRLASYYWLAFFYDRYTKTTAGRTRAFLWLVSYGRLPGPRPNPVKCTIYRTKSLDLGLKPVKVYDLSYKILGSVAETG